MRYTGTFASKMETDGNGTNLNRNGLFLEETSVVWVNREALNTLARDGEGWS